MSTTIRLKQLKSVVKKHFHKSAEPNEVRVILTLACSKVIHVTNLGTENLGAGQPSLTVLIPTMASHATV